MAKKEVRILYPCSAVNAAIKRQSVAGEMAELDEKAADWLVRSGYAEYPVVERATAEPGKKRRTRKSK